MKRAGWLTGVLCAGSLFVVGSVWAQPAEPSDEPAPKHGASAGDDEVTLKNGGILRGTVVELQPGESVAILVAGDKEPRHIPWAQVEDVVRGKYKKHGGDEPPPVRGYDRVPPPPPVSSVTPSGPQTLLHIDSDNPQTRVYETIARAAVLTYNATYLLEQFREVCRAPCDQMVSKDGDYYFGGPGIPDSGDFKLTTTGERTTAKVQAGNNGGIVGVVLTSFGVTGVLTGAIVTGLGFATHANTQPVANDGVVDLEKPIVPGGAVAGPIMLVAGSALLAGGIALFAVSGTSYELTTTKDGAIAPRYWLGEF